MSEKKIPLTPEERGAAAMELRACLAKGAEEYGIGLSALQLEQFTRYFSLLIEWNEKMNLTALTSPQEVAVKHFIDSLTAYEPELFPQDCSLIDVGTGAGFPGLPLKILRPDIRLTLLDSLNKRIKFLETVVAELGLTNVTCLHGRAEETARQKQHREKYDLATSRAVARLSVLAEYTLPFVKRGGSLLALKGAKYQEEAEEGAKALEILGGGTAELREVQLPGLEDKRAIVKVVKKGKTPSVYPRKAGTPEKNPLGCGEKKDLNASLSN